MTKIITGTINRARMQLRNPDGTNVGDISGAAVTVSLESADRTLLLAGPYTASSASPADWTTGYVVQDLPKADLDAALALIAAPGIRMHVLVTLAGESVHYFSPLVPLLAGHLS